MTDFEKMKRGTVLTSTAEAKKNNMFNRYKRFGFFEGLGKDKNFIRVRVGTNKSAYIYHPSFWRKAKSNDFAGKIRDIILEQG